MSHAAALALSPNVPDLHVVHLVEALIDLANDPRATDDTSVIAEAAATIQALDLANRSLVAAFRHLAALPDGGKVSPEAIVGFSSAALRRAGEAVSAQEKTPPVRS